MIIPFFVSTYNVIYFCPTIKVIRVRGDSQKGSCIPGCVWGDGAFLRRHGRGDGGDGDGDGDSGGTPDSLVE